MIIAGEPGVGKSTFMKEFAQDMFGKNSDLFKSDYVFFVRFRDVDYEAKTDLLSFLATGADFVATLQSKERNVVSKNLQNCNDVYILMDGLDEAIFDSEMQGNKCDKFSTAAIFIKRLLSGDILPQAKKLVTSRPHQLASLTDVVNDYNFVANILGLTDDGQQQICDDICKKTNKNHRDKIFDFLNSRPDLKSYCYVPISCILIMTSFTEMEEFNWEKVYSFTTIFLTTLEKWFLKPDKLKNQFQLLNISKLAYDGFLENRLYFRQHHLTKAKTDLKTYSTFLVKDVSFKLLQGKTVSYFCHLTWQELFTAVMLRLYISKEEFSKFISTLDTDRYEVVTKFLFGLCNKDKLDDILDLVNDSSRPNSEKVLTKSKEMLKTMALQKLQGLKDTSSLLQVLGWIYEMHDESFTPYASQCLENKISITGKILPSDIPCLNYVLQFRETELTLNVIDPSFVGNSFHFFINYLSNTLQNKRIQVCKSITVYSTMRVLLGEELMSYATPIRSWCISNQR